MDDINIISAPCAWNEERYDREYDHELTAALIAEEVAEFYAGDCMVVKLDGLADIWFVAIGALWKLGHDELSIIDMLDTVVEVQQVLPPMSVMPHWVSAAKDEIGIEYAISLTAAIAVAELRNLGLLELQARRVIQAICRSNSTKSISRTDSSIKANKDKGVNYVSPTADLELIVKEISNEQVH